MPHKPPGSRRGAGDRADQPRGEIYVEFKQVGQAMKVTAVDAESGVEVVIMGPVAASRNDLERVAVRKLKAQLGKTGKDEEKPDDISGGGEGPGPKGWIA